MDLSFGFHMRRIMPFVVSGTFILRNFLVDFAAAISVGWFMSSHIHDLALQRASMHTTENSLRVLRLTNIRAIHRGRLVES